MFYYSDLAFYAGSFTFAPKKQKVKITDPAELSPQKIKNIVFDWGGVLINIDYQATVNAFKALGVDNFDQHFAQAQQRELFDQLETGAISPDAFRKGIREEFGDFITDQQMDAAWGAMLLDIPSHRIETLKALRKKYRIFLLSNTNQIHEDQLMEGLNAALGFEFFSLFEKVYLSHRVGMRKPHTAIFDLVVKENGLIKEETLFIDDSEQHVNGAVKAGLHAFHLQPGMETSEIFRLWTE